MNAKDKPRCVYVIWKDDEPYRYMVRVMIKRQMHYLGCFKTEEKAIKVYEKFMKEMGLANDKG